MRKFILKIILGFLLLGKTFCAPTFDFAELKFSSAVSVPSGEIRQKKEDSVSTSAGVKISVSDLFFLDNLDARFYQSLPKTPFAAISRAEDFSEFYRLLKEPRYGAGLLLFEKTVPLQIRLGQNSFAKSISKLKNPSPSFSANPLAKSFSFAPGIGASLPTLGSSVQPMSVAVSFSLPEKRFRLPFCAEFFLSETELFGANFRAKHSFNRLFSVQTSFTAARFFLENNSAVLKKAYANFEPDFFYAFLWESNFTSPVLKTNFSLGTHQNPYKGNAVWLQVDGRMGYRWFLVDFSYFAIPTTKFFPKVAPLIGGSSSIQKTVEGASVSPKFVFVLPTKKYSSIVFGFSASEVWKICSTKNAELLNVGKLRFGTEFENRNLDLKFDVTLANQILSGEPPNKSNTPEKYCSASMKGSVSMKNATFSLGTAFKYYPPLDEKSAEKKNCSADFFISPFEMRMFSFQTGVDLAFKGNERTSGTFENGISFKNRSKFLHSSVKIVFSVPF